VNGQLDSIGNCQVFGGAAAAGRVVIEPCKSPSFSMLAVTVGKRSLHHKWQANGVYGSPVIAGKKVYLADFGTGTLKTLSLKTGHVIDSVSVGSLPTFPSEVVDGNHIFVPTLDGITALRGS
jgi:hypothetical protein